MWGDRVFVLSAVKTDREATASERPKVDPKLEKKTDPPTHFYKFIVTAFYRNTGEKAWEHVAAEKVPHEGHHPSHSYCAGSPATDGERLYCCFGSFGLYCYDLSGKPLWSRDLGRMSTRLGWGEAVTPVVHNGALVLNYDQEVGSALYCLDAKSGENRWRVPRTERTTWNTPLVTEYGGKTQVVVNGTNRVRSYDLADGKELWNAPGTTVNPIPSPLRVGDTAVVVGGYQKYVAEAIPLGSSGEVPETALPWRYTKGTPYVPSPVPVGGRLYFTEANRNALTVLDAKTGKPVIDLEPLPGVTSFYASPVFAGGRVYFVDRGGTTVVLKPGDAIDVIATNKLGDPVDASPVPVGKQLFLRGEKYLWCLEGN
jgi:outer membrane protein assembly factor BamB